MERKMCVRALCIRLHAARSSPVPHHLSSGGVCGLRSLVRCAVRCCSRTTCGKREMENVSNCPRPWSRGGPYWRFCTRPAHMTVVEPFWVMLFFEWGVLCLLTGKMCLENLKYFYRVGYRFYAPKCRQNWNKQVIFPSFRQLSRKHLCTKYTELTTTEHTRTRCALL